MSVLAPALIAIGVSLSFGATAGKGVVTENFRPAVISLEIPKKGSGTTKCKIGFIDPYFGALDDEDYYRKKFPFMLERLPSDDVVVASGWAQFDEGKKSWRLRYVNEEDRKQRADVTSLFAVQKSGINGWIVTVKDFTGEERFREKKFYFCLPRAEMAVCGYGSVGLLRDGRKGDRSAYAMKVVRSIEFTQ